MSNDRKEAFGLALPFDTDEPEFRRGVEVGMMWTHLQRYDGERSFTVHADCAEMAIRLGEALGLNFSAEDLADGWVEVTYA